MEFIANLTFILSILVLPITYLLGRTMTDARMNKEEIDELHEKVALIQRQLIRKGLDKHEE